MQKIIEIYPCLLKLSRKQKSVTDGQTAAITIPSPLSRGDNNSHKEIDGNGSCRKLTNVAFKNNRKIYPTGSTR